MLDPNNLNNSNLAQEGNPKKIPVIAFGVLAIVIIALIVVLFKLDFFSFGNKFQSEKKIDNAVYSYIDLNQKREEDKIPTDIPRNLPIETELIVESYVSKEEGRPATLSTFTYISKKPAREVYESYVNALKDYEVVETGKENDPTRSLFGKKGNDDITVIFTRLTDGTKVQINYLKRQ